MATRSRQAALPAFRGDIMQVPPAYSAIKIGGERAYDLAREGQAVSFEQLSHGAQEQAALISRLAYADLLKEAGKQIGRAHV